MVDNLIFVAEDIRSDFANLMYGSKVRFRPQ